MGAAHCSSHMPDASSNPSQRRTAPMPPQQLEHILLPERSTVILLDQPKRRVFWRSAIALYCLLAIVLFVIGFIVVAL